MEILTCEVRRGPRGFEGLVPCEVLDALVCFEGILDVKDLSIFIDPLEGVCTVAVHVAVTLRGTSVSVHNGECMHRFWNLAEEVPLGIGVEGVFGWVLLQGMEEIRCHYWVPDEEHREIDSSHVIVPLLSIELQGKSSNIPQQIR